MSFGRHLNSAGDEFWPALSALTFGASNAPPLVGPLVINETLFHPAPGDDEFVEIYNLSNAAVPLYDPAFPTNSWKLTGLGYTFSNTLSVPPHGFLLVVATDPAAFRAKYSVPAPVQIVGPFTGVLQDSGERLRLERPDAPDLSGTPYIVVDDVRYNDKAPGPPVPTATAPRSNAAPPTSTATNPPTGLPAAAPPA